MSDLSAIHAAVQDLSTKATKAAAENRDEIKALSDEFTKMQGKLLSMGQQLAGGHIGKPADLSAGALFAKSEELTTFVERGTRNSKATLSVPAGSLMIKNTIVGDGDQERVMAPHGRLADFVTGAERRVWLRSLIPTMPCTANAVEFVSETFASSAGTQVDGSSSDSVFEGAVKPQSSATYELHTTPVLTIAHFLKMSKQVASDSRTLSAHIDRRLRYFLELEVERQLIEGDGITELTGFLTTGNHTDLTGVASDDTIIDKVHRGITQLADSDYAASAIVMSPSVWQSVALLKDNEERYLHGMPATGGPRTLWGLPVFLSASMPDTHFIVADMAMAAELQARQDAVVELGYVNDDFTRNLLTVLGELRMALCVLRPAAVIVGAV